MNLKNFAKFELQIRENTTNQKSVSRCRTSHEKNYKIKYWSDRH